MKSPSRVCCGMGAELALPVASKVRYRGAVRFSTLPMDLEDKDKVGGSPGGQVASTVLREGHHLSAPPSLPLILGMDPRGFALSCICRFLFRNRVSLSHPGWAPACDPPASVSLSCRLWCCLCCLCT